MMEISERKAAEGLAAQSDFSKGAVWRNILRMAIPMTVAQLIQVLYNMVDRIYLGHLPGASALALTGVGLTFPIITMISAFTNLFGVGGAPLCSIARGEKDEARAEKIMGNTLTMLLITGVVIMIIGFLFRRPILYLFGASDATYPYADEYLVIYLCGTLFTMVSHGMNGFINAQGFGKHGMLTVSIGAAANILLDPLFIFVFDMGVSGAALATVLSQMLSAIWVLQFLTGKKAILKIRREYLIPDLRLVGKIVTLGLSGFIVAVTNSLCSIACNVTLQKYGGDLFVGVMTVLSSVRELFSLPVTGITNGAQPVLGYNYGAKKYTRVKKAILFTTVIGTSYTVLTWGILMIFPEPFIRMFNSDPELLKVGIPALKLFFFGYFMMSLQFAGQSTFTALGKSRHAIFFSLLRKVVIVVPLTFILPMIGGLGTDGVFLAEPVSNFIGGTACFVTMFFTVWRKLGEDEPDPSPIKEV